MLFKTGPDFIQSDTNLKNVTWVCVCLVFALTLMSLSVLSTQIYFHYLTQQSLESATQTPHMPYFAHTVIFFTVIGISASISLIHRVSLKEHHGVIDILRLMGAQTSYISKQFQWRIFRTSFIASLIGVGLGIALFGVISYIYDYVGTSSAIQMRFLLLDEGVTIYLMSLPFVIGIISFLLVHFDITRTVETLENKASEGR